MKFIILLITFLSFNSYSETQDFREDFFLLYSECKTIIVDMGKGSITQSTGDPLFVGCEKKKQNEYLCLFLDKNAKKLISKLKLAGYIIDSEGIVTNQTMNDTIIINMVSRRFIARSNVNLDSSRIRGTKICTGEFIYESEFKKKNKIYFSISHMFFARNKN